MKINRGTSGHAVSLCERFFCILKVYYFILFCVWTQQIRAQEESQKKQTVLAIQWRCSGTVTELVINIKKIEIWHYEILCQTFISSLICFPWNTPTKYLYFNDRTQFSQKCFWKAFTGYVKKYCRNQLFQHEQQLAFLFSNWETDKLHTI